MPAPDDTPEDVAAAAAFLLDLPSPWAPWPQYAYVLAPSFLATVRRQGWALDGALRAHLTQRPDGVRSPEAVLTARIERLPYRPAPTRCARCGALGSLVHASGRWPRPVCVPCSTAPDDPPAADLAARKAEAVAAIHRTGNPRPRRRRCCR